RSEMRIPLALLMLVAHLSLTEAANAGGSTTCRSDWLQYEPSSIVLHGRLERENVFGPPNFGEDPSTDQIVSIFILELDQGINVKGRVGSKIDEADFECQTRLQLVPGENESVVATLVGSRVLVTGQLFEAESGGHYTNVLIAASSVHADQ